MTSPFRGTGLRLVALGLLAALTLTACSCPEPPKRVILIVVDTLRRDALPSYGASSGLPHVEALAARGQVFPNVVSSFHQTPMSMAAMFTGHTPSVESGRGTETLKMTGRTWCGLARFANGRETRCIPSSLVTLAELLREAGYWTIGIASNSLLFKPFGMDQGFDDWVEVGRRTMPMVRRTREQNARIHRSRNAESVNAAAAHALGRRPHDRFFLYVHYMDVHDYVLGREAYVKGVRTMDRALGALLQALEGQHLLEDAVVLFTSDHGERLGEKHFVKGMQRHGGNPSFEEVLRVPLIVAPPRFDDASRLVRGQDVYGLVAELVGARSAVPHVLEPGELFLTERRWRTYRRGRWKSYVKRADDKLQLVDLLRDPAEKVDVAPEHPAIVETHRKRITELARVLGAPDARADELTEEDKARLRSLGYLE